MTTSKNSKNKVAPKKPAVTNHGVDHGHDARVDELSEYDATHHLETAAWVRPSSLDAPDPRKGMTQRWVRHKVKGEADPRNLTKSRREGWRPRHPDTLPEEYRTYASFADNSNGMIIVDDLILMEIDSRILAQRKAAIEKATSLQMRSVEHDLESTQINGHPILKQHKSSVTTPNKRVQPMTVADDD